MTDIKQKKVDAKELLKSLENLPEEEKFKIFYMVKGIELMKSNNKEPVA